MLAKSLFRFAVSPLLIKQALQKLELFGPTKNTTKKIE